ncbi:lipopolysaccharide biosynthesis protein [Sulfitobacter sp. MOLA879]|uniref:lipopolysaccharide biosynthesis protein n=1 Tax=Sulfitobacter sp. MOLA879 TaxID=3368579 RepID=UPI0037467ADF
MQSNRDRVAKALVGTSISSCSLVILTFATGVLVARALGPEARGIYGGMLLVAQTLVTITGISFADGAMVSLRQSEDRTRALLKTTILTACALLVVTGLILFGFGPKLAGYANSQDTIFFILFAGMFAITNTLSSAFSAYERGNMQFRLTNVSRVVAPSLFFLSLVVLLQISPDAISVDAVLLLYLLTKVPMLFTWAWRYRPLFSGDFNMGFAARSVGTGLRLHPALAISVVAASFDRLVAVSVWDEATLGIYFVAFSAVGAGYGVVVTAVRTVLFPFFSGLRGFDRENAIAKVLRLTTLISLLAAIVGYFSVPYLIPVFYGDDFAQAAEISRLLVIALSITPLHAVVLEAGRSLGRGRASTEMALAAIFCMILGYLVTGYREPHHAIISIAFSNSIAIIMGSIHLIKNRDMRLNGSLVPRSQDFVFLLKLVAGRLRS